jgi:hypothetical protein
MRDRQVVTEVRLRRDPADRPLPRVHVAVDETGQHDPPGDVDDERVGAVGSSSGADRLDRVAAYEYIADEVTGLGIHRQDVPAT